VGVWSRVGKGRVLVSEGSATVAGVTRNFGPGNDALGRYTRVLTEAEMPEHDHTYTSDSSGIGYATGAGISATNNQVAKNQITVDETGGSSPVEMTQPSFGLYVWQRAS